MNFEIGQKVVALCTHEGIKKDQIYVVDNIYNCNCGLISIMVGGYVDGRYTGTKCSCLNIINNRDGRQWYKSSRFAPIIEDHEEEAEKAVKKLIKELDLVEQF